MSNKTWFMDIEPMIASKVKGMTSGLKTKYPKIKYTQDDENEPLTVFPTVYIHEVSSIPMGDDLEAVGVNGVLSTFEVRVSVNTNKSDARIVMADVTKAFIDMKFRPTSPPLFMKNGDIYVSSARFRRVIGVGDTI